MKKGRFLCYQSAVIALLLAGIGLGGDDLARAQTVKQLKDPAPVKVVKEAEKQPDSSADKKDAPSADPSQSENGENPSAQNQSYSVVIESRVGTDGKRVRTKKVWKDGVLVEDEEKTVDGATDKDDDMEIELDGEVAPGIVIRSERNGDFPFGAVAPNATPDEMMKQMEDQMAQMRARQAEMIKRFTQRGIPFGPGPVIGGPGIDPSATSGLGLNKDAGFPPMNPSDYWIGAAIAPIPVEVAAQLNLGEDEGILIRNVVPGSPAEKAGLQKYDVLVKIGEKTVSDLFSIGKVIDESKGSAQKITFFRKGKEETAELTPEKRPESMKIQPSFSEQEEESPRERIRVVRPGMIVPTPEDQAASAEDQTEKAEEKTAEPEK